MTPPDGDRATTALRDILAGSIGVPPGGFTHAALARIDSDGTEAVWAWGGMAADARMRMASISKMATARAVVATALAGRLDLDGDAGTLLETPALAGVRLRHLLSHTSGVTDRAGYVVDPPASPLGLLPVAMAGTPPGTFFRYANLNYILLGMLLERAWDERFDAILHRLVLGPAGIGGGFNWVGVTDRAPVLPVAQWADGALTVQADGPDTDWGAELIWRGGGGRSLAGYRTGQDTTLFSPHAGLRMSVVEAARLVRFALDGAAGAAMQACEWRHVGTNGADCDGLFTAVGLGVTIYADHPWIAGQLVGHAGHALGFIGGAWRDMATGTAWAYALNGSADLTEADGDEAFYAGAEADVMAVLGATDA